MGHGNYENEEQFMANMICKRSDGDWHYYDRSSYRWVGPYSSEVEATQAFLGVEKAA